VVLVHGRVLEVTLLAILKLGALCLRVDVVGGDGS
jgi:hypothetical protein